MAHGKSMVLENSLEVNHGFEPPFMHPQAPWEEFCTVDNATCAMDAVEEIIRSMHLTERPGEKPFMSGMATYSMTDKS